MTSLGKRQDAVAGMAQVGRGEETFSDGSFTTAKKGWLQSEKLKSARA